MCGTMGKFLCAQDSAKSDEAELSSATPPQSLPWYVLPLAGPFGLIVAATMTWLNLRAL